MKTKLVMLFILIIAEPCFAQERNFRFNPGKVWLDDEHNVINAHGGGMLYHGSTYYWYGEYKQGKTVLPEWATWECYRTEVTGVSCYSSKDLLNWHFEGIVLGAEKTDSLHDLHTSKVVERPKVIYNSKTKKFVMWMHIDSADYSKASAGVAVSDTPTGPFTYLDSFRPNGEMSRDQTLFVDDDGKAYQICSSEDNATMYIHLLTDDYLKPTKTFTRNFEKKYREAPAVFKHHGKYYLLTSGCSGWDPNVADIAVADSMLGEWKSLGNPCIGEEADKTFYGQSTYVQPVIGRPDTYVAMFDRWKKTDLPDSRYIWLPLTFEGDKPKIIWHKDWGFCFFLYFCSMNGVKLYLNRCMMALFVLLSASASTASDTKQMQFDKIVLPYDANVVESVCKDSLGMMWFATRRGLFSYDGYNIRRLYEGSYYAVLIVDEETLCLGGDAGLRWLNLRTEQFVTPFGDVPEIGEVRSLKCDNGVLYVGTKSNGLFCLDLDKRIWQRYTLPSGKDDIIYSIEPVNDRLYVAHYGGLACLDNKGGIFDLGIDDNVYALWYDRPNGNLWIGTEHHLLCQNVKDSTTKVVASGSTFNQIVPSPFGEILISSEFGLKILNPQTGVVQTIAHDASTPQYGLPSNTIHQIFCEGNNIWVATGRGVALTKQDNLFEVTSLPIISKSNDGNVFSNILVDSRGDKWMGGDNGLLHLSDHGNKWFKVGNGLKKSIIRSIYEDREHEIWIATDASIARYNRQRDVFDYFSLSDQKGRNANWAYDIYEDNKNRLWIATYMGGLYVVDKTALLSGNGSFILKDNQFDDVDSIVNTIYRFIPDKSGVLWANTSKGLASINTNSGKVTLKKRMYIDNMILVNDVIWIDVQGKLYKYDTQTDRLEETDFQVKDGMIQSFVHDNNRVWMSTSHGLFYIETAGNTIHFYVRPNYNFTAGSYVPSDNTILWGGEDFICKQFLNTTSSGDKPSKVFISSIMVGGIPISDCVPRFENNISLDGREDIALDLSTFAYNRKGSEVFWYKINEDGEWHSLPNGTNRILLSHLSGGSYEIYLSTDSDFKEESVSKYTIKVPYPWFFRWWAWVVYTLIALSVVYYLINYYKRRENALFEQRERERVMALTQEKMDFFVNMSHELKTPLSLIIAPLSKLLSETSNAKLRDSLKSIQNNASRLNDLIHHILDFKQLEAEGETQILSSYIDLCSLISGCISEFETSAKERNISMVFQPTETSVLMDVDVVKIQMVMRNILSNALKYADDEKGKILVSLEKRASEVLVSVQDNGPGVSDSDLPKLFNRYYMGQNSRDGSGIGLSVVKKYVELHGGEVKAENNNGLKVTFSIPLNVLTSVVTEKNIKDGTSEKPIVLIVDDNHEILDFLTTALETSYQCITALSGEQALKTVEERIPDIIITDQMMPGIDGTELCHRIRHNHSTELIPIIMLTAKDDSNTELKSIRSGADVFMPKPFNLLKLQLHIVQLLTKRKAIEQNTRIESMQAVKDVAPVLSNDEELMERIISLINSNMHSEEFNVTKLCDLLCMDQKQLYRKLKQLTGETPVSFIRKQRLQRAAVLLKQERFTVSEVMYQVGFSSASYFSRSFAKEFGVLPKEYLFSDNIAVH